MPYVECVKRAVSVREELRKFDEIFVQLLEKYVFRGFIEALGDCCEPKENQSGPILLKLCGSLTDLRLMLKTACDRLDLKCVVVNENQSPLSLLDLVLKSTTRHLIHVQDGVSLSYLNCLLETFCSCEKEIFAIISIRSNDSHVIRLDPNLAASVPIEAFICENPQPLFNRIIKKLILKYVNETGLLLSGQLLEQLRDSFFLQQQSFVELQNIIEKSIAKAGMREDGFGDESTRKETFLPMFQQYWHSLELFVKFLSKASHARKILDTHIEIQTNDYSEMFDEVKPSWSNFDKEIWTSFIQDAITLTNNSIKKKHAKLDDILLKLEETRELIDQTELLSVKKQMGKNLNVSPSRRKTFDNRSQSDKLFKKLEEIFRYLKPIHDDCSIECVQLATFQNDENMEVDVPEFARNSAFF